MRRDATEKNGGARLADTEDGGPVKKNRPTWPKDRSAAHARSVDSLVGKLLEGTGLWWGIERVEGPPGVPTLVVRTSLHCAHSTRLCGTDIELTPPTTSLLLVRATAKNACHFVYSRCQEESRCGGGVGLPCKSRSPYKSIHRRRGEAREHSGRAARPSVAVRTHTRMIRTRRRGSRH